MARQVYADNVDANGKVFENEWLYIEDSVGTHSVVISQGETITNIEDASTASIETVATKLNELMTALRKTKIVR